MHTHFAINPTTVNPVDINLLRRHLNVYYDYEDDLIGQYANTATSVIETNLNRFIIQKQVLWVVTRDNQNDYDWNRVYQNYFSGGFYNKFIELPHEAISIDSVGFGQWSANAIVLTNSVDYQYDVNGYPARIKIINSMSTYDTISDFQCLYTSGIASNAIMLPQIAPELQQAIIMMTGNLWRNRGDVEQELWTRAIDNLCGKWKLEFYGGKSSL